MFVDFIAEFIMRENIESFLNELSNIGLYDYSDFLGDRRHDSSGMMIRGNCMIFVFHMSLLQDILVADFKKTK